MRYILYSNMKNLLNYRNKLQSQIAALNLQIAALQAKINAINILSSDMTFNKNIINPQRHMPKGITQYDALARAFGSAKTETLQKLREHTSAIWGGIISRSCFSVLLAQAQKKQIVVRVGEGMYKKC